MNSPPVIVCRIELRHAWLVHMVSESPTFQLLI
uniref:Uncharacterized protein n=1 Tax=Anguilla anguilla TaxID=7936 RepID=A0A0E9SUY0_ANGAN